MKNRRSSMFQIKSRLQRESSPIQSSPRKTSFYRFKDSSSKKKIVLHNMATYSKEFMTEILSTISNTCYNMCNRFTGDEATMTNMRQVAKEQTRRLSMEFRKIQNKNELMNLHYNESYSDNPNIVSPLKARARDNLTKPEEQKCDLSYSDISIVEYESEKWNKRAMKVDIYLKKQKRLDKLKGEMMLMDQRKKYHINKTYEKPRTFTQGHFLRKEKVNSLYQPKFKYNRNNLVYQKSYNKQEYNSALKPAKKKETQIINTQINDKLLTDGDDNLFKTQNSNTALETSGINNCTTATNNTNANTVYNISFLSSAKTKGCKFYDPKKNKNFISVQSLYKKPKNNPIKLFSLNESTNDPRYLSVTTSNFTKAKETNSPLAKIKKIQQSAHQKSKMIERTINNDQKEYEESKIEPKPLKVKYNFNLKKIITEFNLDLNKNKEIDEERILLSNAEEVSKRLDKKGKVFLSQLISEMLAEQERLNNQYNEGSNYDRQLKKLKQKKEFKLVSNQTMALKKFLSDNKTVEPKNEKEKIFKIMKTINQDDCSNEESIKQVLLKSRVMKNIKPLLYNNRNIRRKNRIIRLKT